MPRRDLTNLRFGRFVVLSYEGHNYWLCECDCGVRKNVYTSHLTRGATKSCGCWCRDRMANLKRSHGMARTPEYRAWQSMKYRCCDERAANYPDYGGRGITVCNRWLDSFENFYADMGARPGRGYSLERNKVNGNYEPGNCRWATKAEQNGNRRDNLFLEHDGQRLTVAEWSRIVGVDWHILYKRVARGWSAERALTTPARKWSRSHL